MVRPLRLAIADGWYHVFGRGLERRAIFADPRDREHFLGLLSELHARYRVRIHAYALMDNHYHAIIQTPDANLSQGMQWFHGSYGAWFNARHHRVGPLFQGRFRGIPVEDGRWAYKLSFYVHLNPVRVAGLGLDKQGRVLESKGWHAPTRDQVTERLHVLRSYEWSSYRAYAGYTRSPAWLDCATLLARATGPAAYRAEARRLLTHGVDPSGLDGFRDAMAIGGAAFGLRLRKLANGRDLTGVVGKYALRRRIETETVRKAVEQIKGESWERFGGRHGDWGCALFLWGARRLCGLTLRELGLQAGGLDFSAVSKLITRWKRRAELDPEMRAVQERLIKLSNVEP